MCEGSSGFRDRIQVGKFRLRLHSMIRRRLLQGRGMLSGPVARPLFFRRGCRA